MSRDIAIGIVVYNAGESLLQRLNLSISAGFTVYVFDNSPASADVKKLSKKYTNINYFTCGKNTGLGVGISTVCAQAYYDGYPALIFFDQDTGFSHETLNFIEEFYKRKKDGLSEYSAILFNSKSMGDSGISYDENLRDVVLAINSGSLYILNNLERINWHDFNYFVDGVDYKFCLDSARNKLKIGECSWTPGFDHVTEQDDSIYYFLGKAYSFRAYPLSRLVDTIFSNVKLIISSLTSFDFRFASMVTRNFIIYLLSQFLVRAMDLMKTRKMDD